MNDACKTGDISESIFATQALRRGWWVYTSNGHARPADAIVVRPPMRPVSIQIKTASVYPDREDTYGVMVCRGKGPVKVIVEGLGLDQQRPGQIVESGQGRPAVALAQGLHQGHPLGDGHRDLVLFEGEEKIYEHVTTLSGADCE